LKKDASSELVPKNMQRELSLVVAQSNPALGRQVEWDDTARRNRGQNRIERHQPLLGKEEWPDLGACI
jgi:hypothetical protein